MKRGHILMATRKHNKEQPRVKSKKRYILMVVGLACGIIFALDPAILPARVKNHDITQKTFIVRDKIALKLPVAFRPASIAVPETAKPAPKTKETGYKHRDREQLESLMTGGTP